MLERTRNHWWQQSPDHWLCLYWDVYLEHGAWRGRFYTLGSRPLRREFTTAEQAMRFIDHADLSDRDNQ